MQIQFNCAKITVLLLILCKGIKTDLSRNTDIKYNSKIPYPLTKGDAVSFNKSRDDRMSVYPQFLRSLRIKRHLSTNIKPNEYKSQNFIDQKEKLRRNIGIWWLINPKTGENFQQNHQEGPSTKNMESNDHKQRNVFLNNEDATFDGSLHKNAKILENIDDGNSVSGKQQVVMFKGRVFQYVTDKTDDDLLTNDYMENIEGNKTYGKFVNTFNNSASKQRDVVETETKPPRNAVFIGLLFNNGSNRTRKIAKNINGTIADSSKVWLVHKTAQNRNSNEKMKIHNKADQKSSSDIFKKHQSGRFLNYLSRGRNKTKHFVDSNKENGEKDIDKGEPKHLLIFHKTHKDKSELVQRNSENQRINRFLHRKLKERNIPSHGDKIERIVVTIPVKFLIALIAVLSIILCLTIASNCYKCFKNYSNGEKNKEDKHIFVNTRNTIQSLPNPNSYRNNIKINNNKIKNEFEPNSDVQEKVSEKSNESTSVSYDLIEIKSEKNENKKYDRKVNSRQLDCNMAKIVENGQQDIEKTSNVVEENALFSLTEDIQSKFIKIDEKEGIFEQYSSILPTFQEKQSTESKEITQNKLKPTNFSDEENSIKIQNWDKNKFEGDKIAPVCYFDELRNILEKASSHLENELSDDSDYHPVENFDSCNNRHKNSSKNIFNTFHDARTETKMNNTSNAKCTYQGQNTLENTKIYNNKLSDTKRILHGTVAKKPLRTLKNLRYAGKNLFKPHSLIDALKQFPSDDSSSDPLIDPNEWQGSDTEASFEIGTSSSSYKNYENEPCLKEEM